MSDLDGHLHQTAAAGPSRQGSPGNKAVKRTRQTQSCDACRRRKVRCDRSVDSDAPCSNCRMIDETCAFTRTQKKRGPPERSIDSPRPHKTQAVPPAQRPYATDDTAYWTPAEVSSPAQHPPVDTTTLSASLPNQAALPGVRTRLLPEYAASPIRFQQYPNFPFNPNNVFDNVLPRGLFYLVIDHFFDYLHPLNPFVHRPTFLRDIQERREEGNGEEDWVALVLSVVSLTILQLPPSFLPVSVQEARRIAFTCYRHARGHSLRDYERLSYDRQALAYVTSSVMALLGMKETAAAARWANVGALGILRLHEEFSYASYSPVEREMRRRIFWLVFGGDQTLAVIHSAPVCFHPDEMDTQLPLMVDDEFLSADGQQAQPPGHQVVMAGFYYISKIFLIASKVLEFRRRDRRHPPAGAALQSRITEVEALYEAIMRVMDDCPESLKLGPARSPDSGRVMQNDLEGFYRAGPTDSPERDAFLAQQANCYVSQQLYRYVTLEHLQQLYSWQNHSNDRHVPATRAVTVTTEHVAQDLLVVLHSLPIEAIAVNSISIVLKVRYVACGLLDAGDLGESTASPAGQPSPDGKRAENSLLDFVDILAKLDKINRITEGW